MALKTLNASFNQNYETCVIYFGQNKNLTVIKT